MSVIFPQFPSYTQKTTLTYMESVHQDSISNRTRGCCLLEGILTAETYPASYPLRTLGQVSGTKAGRSWSWKLISICAVWSYISNTTHSIMVWSLI